MSSNPVEGVQRISRREFHRTSIALGAATALGSLRVVGANDRVNIGIIGSGGRGRQILKVFLAEPDVAGVGVCDVYEPFREAGAKMCGSATPATIDFRRLLDRKEVDAVIVATPDHWHALHTVSAVEAGKDVYVEKPLSLVVREGRVMVEQARAHARVVAVGSQQRSGAHYEQAIELVRSGAIGAVHHVDAGMTRNAMPGFVARELESGLTGELDWNLWLGPAPMVPFDPFRCIYHFRWFWDYSGGQMTNWGAHHLDIARWAVGATAPTTIAGFGGRYALKDGGETPDVQHVAYQFPGCVVTWTTRDISRGRTAALTLHGTRGTMELDRGGFKIVPEVWTGDLAEAAQPTHAGAGDRTADPPLEVKGGNLEEAHVRNFLDCVKSRKRPNADIEDGHLSAVMCHLGNLATKLGRSLKWDAAKEQCVGDAEANRMLTKTYRSPWTLKGL
jgi:predicted dehydrogenase